MKKLTLKKDGWWWKSMGFTKRHMFGVFFTECLCIVLGGICIFLSFDYPRHTTRFLLIGIFCILLSISCILASILSLLFYIGADLIKDKSYNKSYLSDPEQSCDLSKD